MSKISIKIVEVDQATQTISVKYASENSKKSIDDYDAVAFQLTNFGSKTPEDFIEAIRPQITQYVQQRDLLETPEEHVDLTAWNGIAVEIDAHVFELPEPAAPAPAPFAALANPEVIL
jgi:hypothetical protein